MKFFNTFLILTTIVSIVNGYEIKCKKYYKVEKNDNYIKVAVKNKISRQTLFTLNPDINEDNIKTGLNLCVKGNINFSKNQKCGHDHGSCPFGECCSSHGVCGTSPKHCNNGCNPKYGMCNDYFSKNKLKDKGNKKENYKTIINKFDSEAVDDIMSKLNMNKKEAKNFFKYANKGFSYFNDAFIESINKKYTYQKCENKCKKANKKFNNIVNSKSNNFNIDTFNKYLKIHNESKMIEKDSLLNFCISKCYIIKEISENDLINGNISIKSKRETGRNVSCDPVSKGKISLVNENYMNGCPQYQQDHDSVLTSIIDVNGCSIPLIQNMYNSDDYGFFVPACNSHDLCYGCQAGKETCDTRFLTNMKNMCKIYNKWWQIAIGEYASCIAEAEIFYAAVSYTKAAQTAYDACQIYNSNLNCAYCGTPIIQNTLLYTPFYVKL